MLLNSKYLFITVPFLVSIFFKLKHKYLKKWLCTLFAEKVKLQSISSCIILASIGLSFSIIYCLAVDEKNLFTNSYPSILAAVFNCSYLFITALLWRNRKKVQSNQQCKGRLYSALARIWASRRVFLWRNWRNVRLYSQNWLQGLHFRR